MQNSEKRRNAAAAGASERKEETVPHAVRPSPGRAFSPERLKKEIEAPSTRWLGKVVVIRVVKWTESPQGKVKTRPDFRIGRQIGALGQTTTIDEPNESQKKRL